jgi:hypothetical protein
MSKCQKIILAAETLVVTELGLLAASHLRPEVVEVVSLVGNMDLRVVAQAPQHELGP